jgi:hypothetical protein
MVQDVSQSRFVMIFTEGLMEPLKGWVKAFKPTNLQDAIWRTRDLGPATKSKFIPRPTSKYWRKRPKTSHESRRNRPKGV